MTTMPGKPRLENSGANNALEVVARRLLSRWQENRQVGVWSKTHPDTG